MTEQNVPMPSDPASATLVIVTELRGEVRHALSRIEQHDGDIIVLRRQLGDQQSAVAVLKSQVEQQVIPKLQEVAERKTVSPTAVYAVMGLILTALTALVPIVIALASK